MADLRSLPAWARDAPLRRVLGTVAALAGLLWCLLLGLGELGVPVWARTALLEVVQLCCVTALALLARARSRGEQGRARLGWRLLGASAATIGVSVAVGTLLVVGRRSVEPVVALDALSGLGLLLFGAGLVALCSGAPLTTRPLTVVDTVLAAGACLFLVRAALLTPEGAAPVGTRQQVLYSYLGGMSLVLVLALLLAARWRGDRRTLTLLGCGLGVEVVTLVGLAMLAAGGTHVEIDDPRVGAVFPLGTALLALAAAQRPAVATARSVRGQWDLAIGLPMASGAVVVATAAGLTVAGREWTPTSAVLAGAVGTLLFVRQGLTLLENRRLTLDLEARVAARTSELEASRRHFRDLVQHSSDVIAVMDRTGRLTYCSDAVSEVLGHDASDVLGREVDDFTHPADAERLAGAAASVLRGESTTVACRARHADGSWRSVEVTVGPASSAGVAGSWILNIRDVTDRQLLEERLRYQAYHDPLTGLANRALIQERMRHALLRARRTRESTALVFVDLDHFKRLNDTAGHSVGDEALVHVAEVIRSCIRPSDTAARLGGDEFAVLLEDADTAHGAAVAERIVTALRQLAIPHQRGSLSGASVGVSVADAGAGDGEALLRDADIAMYQAKAGGRDRAAVFVPGMREALVRELDMEQALRRALDEEHLTLAYQPIVDLATGEVAGLEALVRWHDASGAPVPPALFVPLAEQVGLIGALDRWVLATACRYVAEVGVRCPELGHVTLNVNVSARDLDDPDAVGAWVDEAVSRSGLDPARLVLELTETAALPELGHLVVPLQALRDRGVRISLDDFGTGYSSMSSLKQLPLDEIKIDGSFVAGLPDGETATRVVEGIVGMARALRLPVVAEAVETEEQVALLRRLRCDLAQGWLLGAPMAADALEAWAGSRLRVPA